MRTTVVVAALLGFGVASTGFANKSDMKSELSKSEESIRTKAYSLLDKNVLEISFDKGKAHLTEGDRVKIRSLVKGARDNGKVANIIVATYADKASQKVYADADKKLAKARAENIENVLEEVGVSDIETYNMAEEVNWLQKNLNLDEAKVKGAAEGAPATARSTEDEKLAAIGNVLKKEGGASKAVIIVEPATIAH